MKFLNIAFDLDSTLVDFHALFTYIAASTFGLEHERPEEWDLRSAYGLTTAQRKEALDITYGYWPMMLAYDGVWDFLKLLWLATGDPISIVSARPISAADHTHKLVAEKVCKNVSYTLAFAEDNAGKTPYLRRYKYYVEDNADVAWQLATQTDTHVFLIDQPYNQWLQHNNITRIEGVKDLLDRPAQQFWEEK